jgi:hypothetical protein
MNLLITQNGFSWDHHQIKTPNSFTTQNKFSYKLSTPIDLLTIQNKFS